MKKIILLFAISLSVFTSGVYASGYSKIPGPVKSSQFNVSEQVRDNSINNVSVYPNPVSDILKISFKSNNQNKAVITLFNTIGNQVVTDQTEVNEGNNLFSIDIRKNAIAPGVYFVRLAVENEVFLRKLVVK